MIPGKIIRFLEEYACIGFAGTRDRNLAPIGHRVSGWRVGADGGTVAAFVPEPFLDRLIESLLDNGQFAMTVEEPSSHETYQLKGRYRSHRPVTPEEIAIADRIRDRFARDLRTAYPEDIVHRLRAAIPDPVVTVEFEVGEVYLQTPGPGAGSRLYPPADPGGPSPDAGRETP